MLFSFFYFPRYFSLSFSQALSFSSQSCMLRVVMPARFLIRSICANEFIYLLVVLIETALLWRLAAELALLD